MPRQALGRDLVKLTLSWFVVVLLSLSAAGDSTVPLRRNFTHDAYVWQRQWTGSVRDALRTATPWVARWRVLGAELKRGGHFSEVAVDAQALAVSGKPVMLVVRINGQLDAWDGAQIAASSLRLAAEWRRRGIAVAGLEIDHDCATRRLPGYLRFIVGLRRQTRQQGLTLAITALPAWLDAPELPLLLAQLDEAVLQVHSVSDPKQGLLQTRSAQTWVRGFAGLTPVPFRVALPTYGSRVIWDKEGRALAVESEAPLGVQGAEVQELAADPQALAALLDAWRVRPPGKFAGVAWFRLPTRDDRRAWDLQTWHSVMDGRNLSSTLSAYAKPSDAAGLFDIVLRNDGDIDLALPRIISITSPQVCPAADALGNYRLVTNGNGVKLQLAVSALLKARRETVVGWVRCPVKNIDVRFTTD